MRRHETFQVTGHARVDVRIPQGEVELRTGPAGAIGVTIEAAHPDELTVSQLGSTVTVGHERRLRSRSFRVVVEAPAGTDADVATASASVRLADVLGTARVRTASGDVVAETVDRFEATTASGRVDVAAVAGDARVKTVSGDCSAGAVGGRLAATSAAGDVRARTVAGDLEISTTSGDVRVDHCGGDDVSLRSVSGDLAVGLPTGIKVDADITTLSGRTSLPEPAPSSPGEVRRPVRLRMRTVSGDVRVVRSG